MKINLIDYLKEEKEMKLKGGLYHISQIKFAYNSNRIEGSKLSEEQTRYIYETNTISTEKYKAANIDDITETINHFKCFDYLIDNAKKSLSEIIIKEFHKILKNNTLDSRKKWFKTGGYKTRENIVGNRETSPVAEVKEKMSSLVSEYLHIKNPDLDDIINFHYKFEMIHPFQDGNGRVGRLIMFKECLKNHLIPFIIEDEYKNYYYRGLQEYNTVKGYLKDTILYSQDKYADLLKYFKIIKNNEQ